MAFYVRPQIPLRNLQRWRKKASNIDKSNASYSTARTIPGIYENYCFNISNQWNSSNSEDQDDSYIHECNDDSSPDQSQLSDFNLVDYASNNFVDNNQDEMSNSRISNSEIHDNNSGCNIDNGQIIHKLLYEKSEITVSQSVFTIMDLYINNKLTKAALKAILQALQLLLPKPNNMPKTTFTLFQFVRNLTCTYTIIKHYYCKRCLFYNGTNSFMPECPSCSSIEGTWYFYEFDI